MARHGEAGRALLLAGALGLWACSAEPGPGQRPRPDPGADPDAGSGAQAAVAPLLSFTTSLGSLDGQRAFPITSAQALGTGNGDVGFQLSDLTQCGPAEADPDAGPTEAERVHVVTGYIRHLGGGPVPPGTYAVGEQPGSAFSASLQLLEEERTSGVLTTLTADSGTVTVVDETDGKLSVTLEVRFGPGQEAEHLSGQFTASPCLQSGN